MPRYQYADHRNFYIIQKELCVIDEADILSPGERGTNYLCKIEFKTHLCLLRTIQSRR